MATRAPVPASADERSPAVGPGVAPGRSEPALPHRGQAPGPAPAGGRARTVERFRAAAQCDACRIPPARWDWTNLVSYP